MLMNFIAQGQVASRCDTTGQNFILWSLHIWKSNWCQNKKHGNSKAN